MNQSPLCHFFAQEFLGHFGLVALEVSKPRPGTKAFNFGMGIPTCDVGLHRLRIKNQSILRANVCCYHKLQIHKRKTTEISISIPINHEVYRSIPTHHYLLPGTFPSDGIVRLCPRHEAPQQRRTNDFYHRRPRFFDGIHTDAR